MQSSGDPSARPRIMVLYASQRLTGPARGLFQLIEESGTKESFTVCSFGRPDAAPSDFHRAALERGIDARVIEQRFALDPRMIERALKIVTERRYDLVQSHGYKTHILAGIISRKLQIPWIAVSHGYTDENVRIRLYNRLDRLLLVLPDTVVAVSPALRELITRTRHHKRTVTILNAIESSRFGDEDRRALARTRVRAELGIRDEEAVLVVIGRLSPEKGQDQFLEAFSVLPDRDPPPLGLLVGEGPEEDSLRGLVRDLGIEDRVRFLGYRPNVADYYAAADLVVLPSRSEGLPNVVLEAQALERPVVAFDVGGVGEVIEDRETGWLVPAGDVPALSRAMSEAMNHPDRTAAVADRALENLYPKFAVETRVRSFFDEYRRLCALHAG
jgi:glycosyltransferase involved in cell wall biosynthesis